MKISYPVMSSISVFLSPNLKTQRLYTGGMGDQVAAQVSAAEG